MRQAPSPLRPRGRCEFCSVTVLERDEAAFPVTGWEVERQAGGANQIHGRQRVPARIAHANCLRKHLQVGTGQDALAV